VKFDKLITIYVAYLSIKMSCEKWCIFIDL